MKLDRQFTLGAEHRSKSYDASCMGAVDKQLDGDPEFPIYNHEQQQRLLRSMWAREEELRLKQQQLQLREAELKDIKEQLLE